MLIILLGEEMKVISGLEGGNKTNLLRFFREEEDLQWPDDSFLGIFFYFFWIDRNNMVLNQNALFHLNEKVPWLLRVLKLGFDQK